MRQSPLYDRSPLHFNAPVIHVTCDSCTRAELDSLGARYLTIDRAGDHQVRYSHLAIDARLVLITNLAGWSGSAQMLP